MYALYVMKGLYSFELKNKAKMKTETNKTKNTKNTNKCSNARKEKEASVEINRNSDNSMIWITTTWPPPSKVTLCSCSKTLSRLQLDFLFLQYEDFLKYLYVYPIKMAYLLIQAWGNTLEFGPLFHTIFLSFSGLRRNRENGCLTEKLQLQETLNLRSDSRRVKTHFGPT